jgi:hypothetical protein
VLAAIPTFPLPLIGGFEKTMENGTRQHTMNLQARRKGPLFDQRRKSTSPAARKRRLNQLIRELAHDLGFNPDAVTPLERSELYRAGTLILRAEILESTVTSGERIGVRVGDQIVRLSSEARRVMSELHKRALGAKSSASQQSWSPLRSSLDEVTK